MSRCQVDFTSDFQQDYLPCLLVWDLEKGSEICGLVLQTLRMQDREAHVSLCSRLAWSPGDFSTPKRLGWVSDMRQNLRSLNFPPT